MKTKLLTIALIWFFAYQESSAQAKFMTQSGSAEFFSSAPLEDIKARNEQVQSIIDLESQEVVVSMLMTDFDFKKSLMQEHFNENYVESEKYPKALFKGSFASAERIRADQNGKYDVTVAGELTIHGVTRPIETTGTITVNDNQVTAQTKFDVRVAAHDIEIPSIVFQNIAEVVAVTINLVCQPFSS